MEQKKEQIDVYQMVTNRMIELLEKGIVPWKKEWLGVSTPRNLVSGNASRGINLLLLASAGYSDNYFLTFKQVKECGGSVKKGEKAHPIVYWKWQDRMDDDSGEIVKKAFLHYYLVFNVSQCDGLIYSQVPDEHYIFSIAACDRIIEEFEHCPEIRYSHKAPYYHTKDDYINMQPLKSFKHTDAFYAALFTQLIYSTGHTSRLGRKEIVDHIEFGSEAFAKEELTAEMGACFLKYLTYLKDETPKYSADYIQARIKQLKSDKRLVVFAGGQAQKAVDYILNKQPILETHWGREVNHENETGQD